LRNLPDKFFLRDKAIIFDMDGVLVDSQPIHFRVDMEVLASCGAAAALADVTKFAGVANVARWTAYKQNYGLAEAAPDLIRRHAGILMEIFRNTNIKPIAGIPELLSMIRGFGLKTAVASSSSMALIELVVNKLDIAKYFDALVTGEDVERSKPAPDVFLKASGVLRVSPRDCLVVEDSANGVMAAYNAGMKCVGFRNPNSGEQDLSRAGWVVESFGEVTQKKLLLMFGCDNQLSV